MTSARAAAAAAMLAALIGVGELLAAGGVADTRGQSAALFQITNIHQVHLTFTPEQWEAMEPKGGGGFFGGPGGPGPGGRGPGGPFGPRGNDNAGGGPGGPRMGGPAGFGPGMFLAPVMLRAGDTNSDKTVSPAEFQALAEKWFAAWDKATAGSLKSDQIRDGLNAVFTQAGPGGQNPGGPPGGMSLQGPEGKRNGVAGMMGIEFEYVHADLDFDGQGFKDVAVRYKGNGTFLESRGSLKRSLKVDLDKYVPGRDLGGLKQLNFHNNVTDASWMNEVLSHRLFRDAGVPAPRTAYARVFVTVPGKFNRQYFGLYSMVEDVGEAFAKDRFGTSKGALFKPVTPAMFADLGDDWKSYNQTYDPKNKLTPEQKQRMIEFCKFVSHADDAAFAARLGEFVELDELARYLAALVWLADLDGILGPGQNLYLFLNPETQRLSFIPWDMDHSFGQFPMRGTQEQREQLSLQKPWQGENRFLERLFKVEAFQQAYRKHCAALSRELATPARLAAQVDEIAAAIRPAVAEESRDKLANFDRVVAGESPRAAGWGGMPAFGPPTKPIKPFAVIRAQSVADQLAGKSSGLTLAEFGGFGGGRGGRGGPPGPEGFGPGLFLAPGFVTALDADKNGSVSRDEFTKGFAAWFLEWNSTADGALTEEQLRAGLDRALAPRPGAPFGVPGFGPPPGPRPE